MAEDFGALSNDAPEGVDLDESLMLMIEPASHDLKDCQACEVVNELLWSAVNARLKESK